MVCSVVRQMALALLLIIAGISLTQCTGPGTNTNNVTISTDRSQYLEYETVNITIMNELGQDLKGTIFTERYNERDIEWIDIDVGEFEVAEQFEDVAKSYGPAASIENLPDQDILSIKWTPRTQEPIGIVTVSHGKHRIRVVAELDVTIATYYSNEFIIKE